MFKKGMAILLALSMFLCLASCGEDGTGGSSFAQAESAYASSGSAPAEEEEAAPAGETRLRDVVAQRNPADRFEELSAAYEICKEQFESAVASIESAGLAEDETLRQWIENQESWQGFGDMLETYRSEGEESISTYLSEREEDIEYQLSHFAMVYNMSTAIAEDPAQWLENYELCSQAQSGTASGSEPEVVETGGVWPEGHFFSDRMPALEHVDRLLMQATGEEFGFENGTEYVMYVNAIESEQAYGYVDRLIEAGFWEEYNEGYTGAFQWFGRLNDSEGHISIAMLYNGNSAGSEENPQLLIQIYDYDIVGLLADLGEVYAY